MCQIDCPIFSGAEPTTFRSHESISDATIPAIRRHWKMFDPVDLPSQSCDPPPLYPSPAAVYLCVKWFVPFLAPDHRIEPPLFAKGKAAGGGGGGGMGLGGGFSTEAESWLLERNRKPRGWWRREREREWRDRGGRQTGTEREQQRERPRNKNRETGRIKGVLFTRGES